MVEPTGYTALDLIGFTDRGPYDPDANYVKNDLTHVGNSIWLCKIDDTTGITPTEGANWTIFIESATSLAGMSDVDLNTPKAGDGLVHDGNDWTNIPIMTKEQWKKNGAYNLYNHNLQTQVVNTGGGSVTVTVNRTVGSPDYGTFSIVGTVGSATDIVVGALDSNVFKAGQKYKLTGCPSGGGANTYNIRITGAGVEDHGDGIEFTATGSDQMKIQLRGASIDVTFKPMITTDLNATYDDYVPYAMTNRELTKNLAIEFGMSGIITRVTSGNSIENNACIVDRIGKLVIVNVIIKFSANVDSSVTIATLRDLPIHNYVAVETTASNSKACGLRENGELYVDYPRAGWTYAQLIYVAK